MAATNPSRTETLPSSNLPQKDEKRENARGLLYTICLVAWLLYFFYIPSLSAELQKLFVIAPTSEYCSHLRPIGQEEFEYRQSALASSLSQLNAGAYIAEPGASASYFGNITSAQWHLSERPLLFVVVVSLQDQGYTPFADDRFQSTRPKVVVLTPSFEATRAKLLLQIPTSDEASVEFVEWEEHEDPYSTLASALREAWPDSSPRDMSSKGFDKVFVDPSIRHFIVDGLQSAFGPSISVESAPHELRKLRERKSKHEIEIMKCVNEATLLSIRDVRTQMRLGMRESEASALMSAQLANYGLQNGGCLTLFGENAALPHGSGTDRTLARSDLALFDCTASLYGYWSDVSRTFALSDSIIPDDHVAIWQLVHAAQSVAFATAREGIATGQVDEATRRFLASSGHAKDFTHRTGHGIGLEVHEAPYLRGNTQDIIGTGHTFSDEPGVYMEGKVGVRLEDCFYINEDGQPVYLTEGVGGPARTPWHP